MPPRAQFTARRADFLVSAVCLSLLAMLFSPVLAQTVEDSRRNTCLNHCKQLALGILNSESARGYYPTASTAPFPGRPANDRDEEPAGYSWQALILPFMEQQALYNRIAVASEKLTTAPLGVRAPADQGGAPFAVIRIEQFLCPAYSGKPEVDVDASEYQALDGGAAPALTNYFAMSSSHLADEKGSWRLAGNPTGANVGGQLAGTTPPAVILDGNGAMPFFVAAAFDLQNGDWKRLRGVTQAGIRDGTSGTLLFCESREQAYAAWIDGQVAWVVAAWPQNPDAPQPIANAEYPEVRPTFGWTEAQRPNNFAAVAKQRFGVADDQVGVYLPEAMWSGAKDRKFGPSGNHPGVAAHTFADGHSRHLADTIDATVYLHLATRAGREVVEAEAYEAVP